MEGRPAPPGRRSKPRAALKTTIDAPEAIADINAPAPLPVSMKIDSDEFDGATSDESNDMPQDSDAVEAAATTMEEEASGAVEEARTETTTEVGCSEPMEVATDAVETDNAIDAPMPTPAPQPSTTEAATYYGLEALLTPFVSVPEVPALELLECVYDDEAMQLQKHIFRAVKMCTNKNKLKLEEFKINARLYGNGFMDPHEFIDAMAADIGSLEVLVLVPCMLRLQPDAMKKQTLWLALRAYRTSHMAALTRKLAA
ncbi:hypothetical protein ACHHYP_00384 [Achlya hypogyna]|uniref:ZNF598/HEL2 PAH domain-containing protein n=1 Tax=Achlya hypogyna TaxID=1202772 RepID=A0A1V9ZAU6_ACHHY|nr:hypothetical protein ACHHYP_00384 [Achlya hypogyna]